MNSNQETYCLGGRHSFNTNNKIEFGKLNPKSQKLVGFIKGSCSICGRKK